VSLLARVHAAQCAVDDCDRERAPDAALCREDLNALWRHELDRQQDGTYTRRRTFAARDFTGQVRGAAA
jgi:hypothetical protein